MDDELKLLDVVALTEDLPEEGLRRGQVGTIVEDLAPDVYEVEFSDNWAEPTQCSHYVPISYSCYDMKLH